MAMTPAEKTVMYSLATAWNTFLQLDADQDDLDDFRRAIHDAQRIVMSRDCARTNPETCAEASAQIFTKPIWFSKED